MKRRISFQIVIFIAVKLLLNTMVRMVYPYQTHFMNGLGVDAQTCSRAISLRYGAAINTLRGMAVDPVTLRPALASITGGLSGPALKPVALAMVHALARGVRIPVIGNGGIGSGEDAVEFLACGASAVQVGTATFYDPTAPLRIAREIEVWCRRHDVGAVATVTGRLRA